MDRLREVANGILLAINNPLEVEPPEGYSRDPLDPSVFHPKKYCVHRKVEKTHVSECGCNRYTHTCMLKNLVSPKCFNCPEKRCE